MQYCRFLLPPVIFHAGLSVKRQLFMAHLVSILSFGVLGTVICFVLMSGGLFGLSQLNMLRMEVSNLFLPLLDVS
jgi:NhaP-type Na+/H+ or K+/H+ antiporter